MSKASNFPVRDQERWLNIDSLLMRLLRTVAINITTKPSPYTLTQKIALEATVLDLLREMQDSNNNFTDSSAKIVALCNCFAQYHPTIEFKTIEQVLSWINGGIATNSHLYNDGTMYLLQNRGGYKVNLTPAGFLSKVATWAAYIWYKITLGSAKDKIISELLAIQESVLKAKKQDLADKKQQSTTLYLTQLSSHLEIEAAKEESKGQALPVAANLVDSLVLALASTPENEREGKLQKIVAFHFTRSRSGVFDSYQQQRVGVAIIYRLCETWDFDKARALQIIAGANKRDTGLANQLSGSIVTAHESFIELAKNNQFKSIALYDTLWDMASSVGEGAIVKFFNCLEFSVMNGDLTQDLTQEQYLQGLKDYRAFIDDIIKQHDSYNTTSSKIVKSILDGLIESAEREPAARTTAATGSVSVGSSSIALFAGSSPPGVKVRPDDPYHVRAQQPS